MRISDWSSDVCSSDLFGVSTLTAAVSARMQRARKSSADRHLPAADCWFSRVAARLFRIAPPICGPAPLNRSEEHTSELQSLMRISYAVFCLKKKKKQ